MSPQTLAAIALIKHRLSDDRSWCARWVAGDGRTDPTEFHRRSEAVAEAEQILSDLGVAAD